MQARERFNKELEYCYGTSNYTVFRIRIQGSSGSGFEVFWIRIEIFGWIRIQLNRYGTETLSLH